MYSTHEENRKSTKRACAVATLEVLPELLGFENVKVVSVETDHKRNMVYFHLTGVGLPSQCVAYEGQQGMEIVPPAWETKHEPSKV